MLPSYHRIKVYFEKIFLILYIDGQCYREIKFLTNDIIESEDFTISEK